jgi:Protein of unknown function (DUF2846)
VVYFYRPTGFAGSGLSPLLHLDGNMVGPLKKGGYTVFELDPGMHIFLATDYDGDMAAWADDEDIHMELELKSGDELFFKFEVLDWSVNSVVAPNFVFFLPIRHFTFLSVSYALNLLSMVVEQYRNYAEVVAAQALTAAD